MISVNKNDMYVVDITDMSTDGEGIGKIDGYTLFVKDTVIGDKVEVKIMKAKKNYAFARLMSIIEPSPDRVEPRCEFARRCGGCQIQHMSYKKQLEFKNNLVLNNLKRIGGLSDITLEPVIGMENPYNYRNKAQYPVGSDANGNIIMGFYAGRTHSIIENYNCHLGVKENEKILLRIKRYMEDNHIAPYNEEKHTGIVRHILIRKGFTTGELMVCVVVNSKKLPHADRLYDYLKDIDGMTSISYNVNCNKTNVILGDKTVTVWGSDYITDYIGDVKYQISPKSFYQVNPVQTKKLYEKALEYASLTGNETVFDLYCGIGTISLFLAQKAKKVYGVEIVPEAIADANNNAKINNIDNAEFYVGKAEEVIPKMYKEQGVKADVIVVDPPRKGCDEVLLDTMVKMSPKRIVYVSCDSATLARDVKILCGNGYEVERAVAVDQFPHTGHVETVVLLSHKKPDGHINVKVEFGEGEGKVPLDNIAKRAESYKPKERVTYKMIKEYIEAKYGFKVHTAYIAEVKRDLGLPMYDAPNAVEELKQPRKHPTAEKVEAIKDALKHFEVI